MTALRRQSAASQLPAALLVGLLVLAAPSLFHFTVELTLPLFARLLRSDLSAPPAVPMLSSLALPLVKILGTLLALAAAAGAGALAIRRALDR